MQSYPTCFLPAYELEDSPLLWLRVEDYPRPATNLQHVGSGSILDRQTPYGL